MTRSVSKPNCSAGLTLVEMLVVLVIVGLVSTLLVQGLGNALSLYSRVQSKQKQAHTETMIHRWWRSSISATAPNRLGESKFSGGTYKLDIDTYRALLSEEGMITNVNWEITDSYPYYLLYEEIDRNLTLNLRLDTQQKPSFEYMNTSGQWYKKWPLDERQNDLPEAVRINAGEKQLHAEIRNHKDQIFFVDEIGFGRGN